MKTDEEKLEEARNKITTMMANTMDLYGIPPSIGRLYATLYFSDGPMTLDELKEAMGMSKTSMSTGVRKLENDHFINKVWEKGVRKDLYEAQTDFFKSFVAFYCKMWYREIELNMEAIKKAEPILKELTNSKNLEVKEKAQKDMVKLSNAKEYYEWLKTLVISLENGEIFDFIPKK